MNTFSQTPRPFRIAFLALALIAVGLLIWGIHLNTKLYAIANPGAASQAEIKEIASEVGKYMVLPTDETPTLATVSDPAKLKDQPFFANALSGDKVLIYTNARKAILWRPSISKIIEVSPLNVPTNVAPTTPTTK